MANGPYSRFAKEDLILRDYLAADRTVLANESTFLAYVRTALTFFIAGVTFIRFFDSLLIEVVGWLFIPLGIAIFALGLWRYKRMKDMMESVAKQGSEPSGSSGG